MPAYRSPPNSFGWLRHDPLLQSAFAICALLIGFQLAVTLLRPSWTGAVTDWLRTTPAWPAVLLVAAVSSWSSRARRREAPAWWLCTAALLTYAIARTIWTVEGTFIYRNGVPFPAPDDLFFALQYPLFLLAVLLIPRRRLTRPRVILLLDYLLWVGSAVTLSWFFLLAPIVNESHLSPLAKEVALSGPVGDLFVLLGLTLTLVRGPRAARVQAPVLGMLIAAFACLIVADSWAIAIVLHPPHIYRTGQTPDLFWLSVYLLLPLAALVQFRAAQRERALGGDTREQGPSSERQIWRDIKASLRTFLPIVAGLVVSALVVISAAMRAVQGGWQAELGPIAISFGLLLLVFMRQAIICLDHARLRREMAVAQVREQSLVELNRHKDDFLGAISHELRTPLTSLQGYIELLTRRSSAWQPPADAAAVPATQFTRVVAEVRAILADSAGSLQRLTRLANDLLDDTRIRDGQLNLRMMPCDLYALVHAAVQAQRAADPKRVIHLHPVCAPSADGSAPLIMVEADADRIVQVIANYLSNALKYSKADCPVKVLVEVEATGNRARVARVAVRDQGPGLLEAERTRVWERYPHIETVTVQYGSGVSLGLGLSISKAIIERHGGEVGVESVPGQGCTFWFTLPLLGPLTSPAIPLSVCP